MKHHHRHEDRADDEGVHKYGCGEAEADLVVGELAFTTRATRTPTKKLEETASWLRPEFSTSPLRG